MSALASRFLQVVNSVTRHFVLVVRVLGRHSWSVESHGISDAFYDNRGVAHFCVFVSERRALLTPNRRNVNLVSKNKWRFCILGPWDFSSGSNLISAEVIFRMRFAWSSSSEEPRKNEGEPLYRRTPPVCSSPCQLKTCCFFMTALAVVLSHFAFPLCLQSRPLDILRSLQS